MKESKIPKLPVSKPGPSLPTTTKSTVLGASYTKHNQISQSDNIQAIAGLRGFSKNTKDAPNKTKSGPGCLSAKSSIQRPRRNKANSPSKLHSSTNPLPALVSKTNVGLVVTQDPVRLATGMHALDGHDVSRKTGLSFPQNTHSLQTTKPSGLRMPSSKPSGLRMPSPSLGFFGQPKSSTSHSLSQRTTQSCNLPESSIPNLPKLGASNYLRELRPPHAPGKMPEVVIDAAASGNVGALRSSMDCAVPCAVNKAQMIKVACDPKSPEVVKSNEELRTIIDADKRFQGHAEPDKVEQISYSEAAKRQTNDNELLSQSGISDHFKRENNYKNVTIVFPECEDRNGCGLVNPRSTTQLATSDIVEHQHIEEKECSSLIKNQGVILESQCGNGISVIEQDSSTMHNDCLRNTHYVNEQSGDQAELINPSAHKADQISHGENYSLKTNGGILFEDIKPFEQSQKHNSGDFLDANPNTQPSSGSIMECSYGPSQHQTVEEANKDAAGFSNLTKKHAEVVQMQFLDGTLLDESCNSNLNTPAVHTPHLIVDDVYEQSGEHPEPQSSCGIVEQTSQSSHGFRSDGCLLLAENISSEEYLEEPGAMQDGAVDADEIIEQPHVEAAVSGTEEMVPSVEIHDGSIDTRFRHYIKLRSEATSEFDSSLKMSRDHTTDSVISTPADSKELGSLVPSAQTSLNGSSIIEILRGSGLESTIAVEEAETNCFSDNPHEDNQKIKTNDGIFFEENRSFKKSRTGDLKDNADVSPVVQGSTGSELSSYNPSHLKNTVYTNEGEAGADNMTNKSHVGDAKMYLDSNLLVGSCNSGLSTSAVQTPHIMFVDDANEQIGEQLKLQDPHVVDECVFEGNQVSPAKQDVGAGVEKMDEHPHSDAPSGSVEIKSSAENHKNASIDAQFRHDVKFCDQATSSECDSALSTSKAQTTGVITAHKEFCSLTEESGLLVQALSNESSILNIGVDVSKHIMPDEIEVKISQNIVSPIGKLVVADANELSGEQLMLQNPCIVDECVSQDNRGLHFNDYILLRESTNSEELQEEKVPENVEYVVPDRIDAFGSESERSKVVAHVSPAIQDSGAGVEKMDEHPHVEDASIASTETEPSAENHKYAFIDEQFSHDMELCGRSSSSESDLALRTDETETADVVSTLNEESGLLVQMLSNESGIMAAGVDRIKCTLPDETEVKISQDIVSPVNELVVSGVNEESAEQLMLQDPCIGNECVSQDNHGLHFNDYVLLGESTNSEELQEEKVPENVEYVVPDRIDAFGSESERSEVVAHVSPAIQDSGAGMENMDEHPHVEDASIASTEIEPSVENHKCAFIDVQFSHDMELCGRSISESDLALRTDKTETTDVISILNEESGLLVQMFSNENGTLAAGVDRIKCTLPDESEVKISQDIVCPVNELVGSGVNEESAEQLMLQDPCIGNECVSLDNHKLHFRDYLLLEKSTGSEELLEDNVPDCVQYVVPEQSDAHGNESKSPNVVDKVSPAMQDDATEVEKLDEHSHVEDAQTCPVDIEPLAENHKYSLQSDAHGSESKIPNVVDQVSPTMQDDATEVEKLDDQPHAEDAQSCPVDIEPSAENHKYSFMDSQFMYGIDLCGQATSSESNIALKTSKAQSTDVVTTYKAVYSSSNESGFRTTSNESSILGIGVDGIKCILPDENEVKSPQNIVSPAGELYQKLDNVICLTEDDDATKPIKNSENGAKRGNLMIKPPANAIPFSDEWLAAMEAAGEDILTMKSGAVQHSPPDKSVPEPGPWSPVKRKNNQIGPYDCTKFTNIAPPDSH
ncbi:uncharacterized protein LOC132269516 isoform X2 [Cornus florida]|uniref:uncharacterized protein LOC132269516 isoform X2 n=1 Tax=Cornus florida TaxID=4283 RepID=UPI00289D4B6B|nr:uncharacterized protein LOC132269516 isoform X2 [Cornus florida]